ncbi:slipin family protein [Gordonia sp. SL306]|uniref:slipin family protein n=1 Tax=Gordonia sp. SL306 TaxID=2995145 RepID=UPI0022718798|nr:slipin family protein [Gordonia sp. SL306]WAC53675.1 slipin family protein [Gordonia sp. SL306]
MSIFQKVTVEPGRAVLEYRDGKLARVLRPGVYTARSDAGYVVVDLRERLIPVALQEVLTSDAMAIRASMSMRLSVVDPVAFTERAADPIAMIYLTAQIALRRVCASLGSDELIRRGDAVDTATIRTATADAATDLGVEVREVVVKDVIVPAEVRAAALELVTAKSRGLAKLEAARAETAALRALANAGRLLDAHPALAHLRLVQEAPPGARVVLAVGGSDVRAPDA